MPRPLLVDLFCKAGGAGMGYHRAGFDVLGVDIEPQPNYPFRFEQADALDWLREEAKLAPELRAAVYHASPPCQPHSPTRKLWNARQHLDLIPATRPLLVALGQPYIIENVVGAPLINAVTLCGVSFGLKVFRHRRFESNVKLTAPIHQKHDGSTGSHRGYSSTRSGRNGFICVAGHNFERDAGARAMGIDWMGSRAELAQAIPPAYTEYLGRQLLAHLTAERVA